ncbi:MAG: glycerol-3-phosphate acyltransferase [Marinilabiliales bacterium]|nr:glycerol-3-phosphate acyltransferase [Marinilabiliales bacterium]
MISYLLGSISFARLIVKLWTGKDVTEFEVAVEGTEDKYKAISIGGNTVSTALGAKGGMTVGILDILKVVLPTLAFKLLYPDQPAYMLIAAVGGLVGHIWPLYYRFHGGAGFSAIMGGLLVIDWLAVLVSPLPVSYWAWSSSAISSWQIWPGSGCSSPGFGGGPAATRRTSSMRWWSTSYSCSP